MISHISSQRVSRRSLVRVPAVAAASLFVPPVVFAKPSAARPRWKVERPTIAAIGLRYQGSVIADKARAHGDLVALCDVDRHVREQARAAFGSTASLFEDYRELLARPDIDAVLIGTPDHWHAKMLMDACRSGRDVYCEKPLTLTIDEGRRICEVVAVTGRIVQVGSWQRSDHRFRLAVEMVRAGRIGDLRTVDVVLGKNATGGPFQRTPVPKHFHWNLWQGQTPDVPYIAERSHYTFRWWQEYSGGQLTDWGAHHVDIAHWAIDSQPLTVSGTARWPEVVDGYNVPIDFDVTVKYVNGVVLTIRDTGRNGILFTGTAGRIFVNRGDLEGAPVEALAEEPLPREQFRLYPDDNLSRPERVGKLDAIVNHMGNFFDCVDSRRSPLSEVMSQHRSISVCHLANIALKLGRSVNWDASREQSVDDAAADQLLTRPQRTGFEVL
jgi:predicted dehydrogenase